MLLCFLLFFGGLLWVLIISCNVSYCFLFLKQLARSLAGQSGTEVALTVLREHRQLIGVFLRRANARAIISRDPSTYIPGPDSALTALADTDIGM